MREKTKKQSRVALVAWLLAAMMLLAPVMTAHADPLPPSTGNLIIHKIISQTPGTPGNGEPLAPPPAGTPINGVVFDIYLITTPSLETPPADVPAAGMAYVLNDSSGTLTMDVYNGNTKIESFRVTKTLSVTTAGSGSAGGLATASNLPQGYYLVVENIADSEAHGMTNALDNSPMFISSAVDSFVVAVPMTNPAGNGWLTDVHVYPKNDALTVKKEVESSNSVKIGDTVSYAITASVPHGIATAVQFVVTDTLDTALDFVSSSVVIEPLTRVALIPVTDYTVVYDTPSRTLTITFTTAGKQALQGATNVRIEFDTTVNANILTKDDYIVSNDASLLFENDQGNSFEAETDGRGEDIHTAAIEITKTNENGAPLNGSRFRIASSPANIAAGNFLKITTAGVILDFDETGYGNATNVFLEIAPSNGGNAANPAAARFEGLIDQTYYVVEVTAPATYNLLDNYIEIDLVDSTPNHTYRETVENSKGFTLPSTGGVGTAFFAVFGVALLGLAVIIAIRPKSTSRRRAQRSRP